MREIKLFGKALNITNVDYNFINKEAMKKGFLVDKGCTNDRVLEYLSTQPLNYASTFYKTWQDITSKNRFELFIDQLLHYQSSYYIPNNQNEALLDFTNYTLIKPITKNEIENKIQLMFNSGIPLKEETIKDCFHLIQELSLTINFNTVKNKEVMMFYYKDFNILPEKEEEMLRFLVFLYTNTTLLIKSKEVIKLIKGKKVNIESYINKYGVEKLSSIFLRFKPLFLAMKKGNERIINKLRRCAIKNHKAYEKTYFQSILESKKDISSLKEKLKTISSFKKIALLQTINTRLINLNGKPYVIRNGKMFFKTKGVKDYSEFFDYYTEIYVLIYNSLIDDLNAKKCRIKLPKNINLALPTSEKNFIGHIPMGSYIDFSQTDMIIGIHWIKEDGAQDLDLSLLAYSRTKIGWNGHYNNDGVCYSGDITYPNPEAVELIYFKNNSLDSVVKVNSFSAMDGAKYTLFFGKVEKDYIVKSNTMLHPDNILFKTKLEMTSREMLPCTLINNKLYFVNIRQGNKRVSTGNNITTEYIAYNYMTSNCFLDMRKVLEDAKFEIVDDNADIDLTEIDKSKIIQLFA